MGAFKDIGEKLDHGMPCAPCEPKKKNEKWYQSLTLDAKDFPWLYDKKAGEECVIVMKVNVSEKIDRDRKDKPAEKKVTVELVAVKADEKTHELLQEYLDEE